MVVVGGYGGLGGGGGCGGDGIKETTKPNLTGSRSYCMVPLAWHSGHSPM